MERFHYDIVQVLELKDSTEVILDGWAYDIHGQLPPLELRINGQAVPAELTVVSRPDIQELARTDTDQLGFNLIAKTGGPVLTIEVNGHPVRNKMLENGRRTTDIILEAPGIQEADGYTYMDGTVFNLPHTPVTLTVLDGNGNPLPAHIHRYALPSHAPLGYDNEPAFFLSVPTPPDKKLILLAQDEDYQLRLPVTSRNPSTVEQVLAKVRRHGLKGSIKKAMNKLAPSVPVPGTCPVIDPDYMVWRQLHQPDLEAQRNTTFSYNPKFSVVTAAWNTPLHLMDELIQSLEAQTYPNWELCIADGSDNDNLQKHMEKHASNPKIKYKRLEGNLGIAGNTNEAIKLAEGDYISFMDHDDFLSPDAFFENAKALQQVRHDFLYSDEDNAVEDATSFCGPYFKPDFSPELLNSNNYITHFTVVSRKLLDRVGLLNPEMDGSQDYDFILRATEQASSIHHIPKVLYHWRQVPGSTALGIANKSYALENGRKALQAHYERLGIDAQVKALDVPFGGCYHTTIQVKPAPLVSIITKGRPEISDPLPYEIVPSVQEAKGSLLLFLDDRIVSAKENALTELAGILSLPGVGAVGGKVLNPDNTIQTAGLVLGEPGNISHAFAGHLDSRVSRNWRADIVSDFLAVSDACLMTARKHFDTYGMKAGPVQFGIDLHNSGLRTALNPWSVWHSSAYGLPDPIQPETWAPDPYHNPTYAQDRPAFFVSLEESE